MAVGAGATRAKSDPHPRAKTRGPFERSENSNAAASTSLGIAPRLRSGIRNNSDLAQLALARSKMNAIDRYFAAARSRSEEHTSELQSLMRISYAVFCLKKKKTDKTNTKTNSSQQ